MQRLAFCVRRPAAWPAVSQPCSRDTLLCIGRKRSNIRSNSSTSAAAASGAALSDDLDFGLLDDILSGGMQAAAATPAVASPRTQPPEDAAQEGGDSAAKPALSKTAMRPWEKKARGVPAQQPQAPVQQPKASAAARPRKPTGRMSAAVRFLTRVRDRTARGPAAEQPAAEQPAAVQPAAEQPAAEQPAAVQPAAEPASKGLPALQGPLALQPRPRLPDAEASAAAEHGSSSSSSSTRQAGPPAATSTLASDPIFLAARAAAASSSAAAGSADRSGPSLRRRSRAFGLLEPDPTPLQKQQAGFGIQGPRLGASGGDLAPAAGGVGLAGAGGGGAALPVLGRSCGAAASITSTGFVPSTRSPRSQRVAAVLHAAPAQKPAAAAAGAVAAATAAAPPPPSRSVPTPSSLAVPVARQVRPAAGAVPLASDLPDIDEANWRQHVRARFPNLYDPSWHTSLFEFLSDLWPAVGKAHAGQGSSVRGGMPSARTRAEQQELLLQAYGFAALCWGSQDERFRNSVVLSFVGNVCDHDAMFEECVRHLPEEMLGTGVVPMMRALHPQHFVMFLSLARDRLGLAWAPKKAMPRHLAHLLTRLELLRRCHPEVDLAVLGFLDELCNSE